MPNAGCRFAAAGTTRCSPGAACLSLAPAERVEAVVPDRARREGEPHVGADELGEGLEVAALERREVAPRDGALLRRRVVRGRPIDAARGEPVPQARAGS